MKNQTDRLLRLHHVIGDEKRGIPSIVPVSRTAWYDGIATGVYPPPIKLSGGRTSAWRESDVMAVVAGTYQRSEAGGSQ